MSAMEGEMAKAITAIENNGIKIKRQVAKTPKKAAVGLVLNSLMRYLQTFFINGKMYLINWGYSFLGNALQGVFLFLMAMWSEVFSCYAEPLSKPFSTNAARISLTKTTIPSACACVE